MSLIRLGDGEGAILGYPKLHSEVQIRQTYQVWFGKTILEHEQIVDIGTNLKQAISAADIVGMPREKQYKKSPFYSCIPQLLKNENLITDDTFFTHAAIHRLLHFALLLRPILGNRRYIGLIGGRDIRGVLKRTFNVQYTDYYEVKSEAKFPNNVSKPHYPDAFYEMKEQRLVKGKGDIFLVGAGIFGKVYCQWIKEQGGIAIDLGAMFDAWSGVKSRLINPIHSIDLYAKYPQISRQKAVDLHNILIKERELDTPIVNVDDIQSLNEW